ncbi:MAG: response regulator transcription factor [Acidimicrobiia bacterium]|nr:response regulator transcription factor [Acidimicrobiia bacterium]
MTPDQAPQKVLVVEDDPTLRRLIELCLKQPNREIDLRSNGSDGLEAYRDSAPDVVVLDLVLPGIDGWDVLRELRAESDESVAVVIVTADATAETRDRAVLSGADALITKPFRPDELRNTVDLIAPR